MTAERNWITDELRDRGGPRPAVDTPTQPLSIIVESFICGRLLVHYIAAVSIAIGCFGGIASAQDDDEPEEKVPQQKLAARAVGVFYTDELFDRWVFQGTMPAAGRINIDSTLTLAMEEVDRCCKLSEAQKQKLRLAARGDVARFVDRAEQTRKKLQAVKHDQNKVQEIYREEVLPLRSQLTSGLFGEQSLFRKVLRKTLDADQAAMFKKDEDDRRTFRHRAVIAATVTRLENGVPLRDEQRQSLLKLLEAETHTPSKLSKYDYHVVLYQMSRLPNSKLRPIFDEVQWHALRHQFAQAKWVEQILDSSGELLPIAAEGAFRMPAEPPGNGGGIF